MRWQRLAAIVVVLLLLLGLQWLGEQRAFNPIHEAVFDTWQRLWPRGATPDGPVVVAIDDASLTAYGQWPWPRTLIADLVRRLGDLGATVMGLDMLLAEPDRYSPQRLAQLRPDLPQDLRRALQAQISNDQIFAQVVRDLPVVVGQVAVDEPGKRFDLFTSVRQVGSGNLRALPDHEFYLGNLEAIDEQARGRGFINATPDPDGVLRRMPVLLRFGEELAPSLPLELLRLDDSQNSQGRDWLEVHLDQQGLVGVDWGGGAARLPPDGRLRPWLSVPRTPISAADILDEKDHSAHSAIREKIRGHLVLVGATATALGDYFPTPISPHSDGVEILAQMVEVLAGNQSLARPPWAGQAECLATLLVGLMLLGFSLQTGLRWFLPLALGLVLLPLVLAIIGFRSEHWLLDPLGPMAMALLGSVGLMLVAWRQSEGDKRELARQVERERLEVARMAGELEAARRMQMGMLPQPSAIIGLPSRVQVDGFVAPAREAGGDLYDVFMLDERRLFFVVGDVSGKGVGAALFMALSKALFKSAALRPQASVGELLGTANREISRDNPDSMFVTVLAGILDVDSGALEFSNAGHPFPYLLRASGSVERLENEGGPPVCAAPDYIYPSGQARLGDGDFLLVVTDGVTEARNSRWELFGSEGLEAALAEVERDTDPYRLIGDLYARVREFERPQEPSDDIAFLAIRFKR